MRCGHNKYYWIKSKWSYQCKYFKTMIHKLRKAIENREAHSTLEGMIELDEGFLQFNRMKLNNIKVLYIGRGTVGKQNVLITKESTPL